jgi:hypothetical protein
MKLHQSVSWIVGIVICGLLIFGLFELQRIPYRPPVDMSPALNNNGLLIVRGLIAVLVMIETVLLSVVVRQFCGREADSTDSKRSN